MKQTNDSTGNLSIAMFDIDDFKKVNDNYGHIIEKLNQWPSIKTIFK